LSILDRRDPSRPYLIAHRGNSARCPENTVEAFQQAVKDGADIIETDVRLSADGHFVLIHDATLDRTTDGTGRVAAHTLGELKNRRIRHTKENAGVLRIPTLDEMAAVVPAPFVLALELKAREFRSPDVCARLARELARSGASERALILSSHRRHLEAWRQVAPEDPVGLVSWLVPWPPGSVPLVGPLWPVLRLNPFYVRTAHGRGQLVCPLDPNPDGRLHRYLRAGCDAILSNDPGTTRAALDRSRPLYRRSR
jgi:glycerophosphoryl diester phosphodiesterase